MSESREPAPGGDDLNGPDRAAKAQIWPQDRQIITSYFNLFLITSIKPINFEMKSAEILVSLVISVISVWSDHQQQHHSIVVNYCFQSSIEDGIFWGRARHGDSRGSCSFQSTNPSECT